MSEKEKIKVYLEAGGVKVSFEGEVNQVIESMIKFLTRIYPGIEIIQKISFIPDLAKLADMIAGIVEITVDGPIIVTEEDLTARNAICLALLGAYVGKGLGILQKDTLTTRELSMLIGKAKKTIMNELPKLTGEGLVERTSGREYKITMLGIKRAEKIVETLRKNV